MATTLFTDKLSHHFSVLENITNGYYIANGKYHENLSEVNVDAFIVALKTIPKMFSVAFDNSEHLQNKLDKLYSNDVFWNNLKKTKERFDHLEKNQLAIKNNTNNVAEIIDEVGKDNQQVITQLKKAVEYNLTILPILYFKITNNEEKESIFSDLQLKLIDVYSIHNSLPVEINYNLNQSIVDEAEILSWFDAKEHQIEKEKENKETQQLADKKNIENEQQDAIAKANAVVEEQIAVAKKAQEDALKMMAELQKKHGF